MSHPDTSRLKSYLKSENPPHRLSSEAIEEHLEQCSRCRDLMDSLSSLEQIDAQDDAILDLPQWNTDRYRFLGKVGRGGMAEVYRCHDLLLDREVAIKVIRPELIQDEDAILRFDQEARVSARLQHPGVVPVHDFGHLKDGRPFIALKLIEGKLLRHWLSDDRDSVLSHPAKRSINLLNVFQRICETMSFVHQQGIIHRDLKPHNIMIGEFGEVQIMDWGIAKVLVKPPVCGDARRPRSKPAEDQHALDPPLPPALPLPPANATAQPQQSILTGVVGTPGYMAPEQACVDQDSDDPRTDVYALGVILNEILASEFHAGSGKNTADPNALAVSTEARDKRLDLPSAIEAQWNALVGECLARSRMARPADAGQLAIAVSGLLDAQSERLRQAELLKARAETEALSERRRRKLVVSLSCIAVLFIATVSAMLAINQVRTERQRSSLLGKVDVFLGLHQNINEATTESVRRAQELRVETDQAIASALTADAKRALREKSGMLAAYQFEAERFQSQNQKAIQFLDGIQLGWDQFERRYNVSDNRVLTSSRDALPIFQNAVNRFVIDHDLKTVWEGLGVVPVGRILAVESAIDDWVLLTHLSGNTAMAATLRQSKPIRDQPTQVDQVWRWYDQGAFAEILDFATSSEATKDVRALRLAYLLMAERDGEVQSNRAIRPLRKWWMYVEQDFLLNWELAVYWKRNARESKDLEASTKHSILSLNFFRHCQTLHENHAGAALQMSRILQRMDEYSSAASVLEAASNAHPGNESLLREIEKLRRLPPPVDEGQ